MASVPNFTNTPRLGVVQISTANTNRDGTGTIASLLTGVASGTRVDEIWIKATGTTTAGIIRVFVSLDSGSTWRLYTEKQVTAITPSGTTGAYDGRIGFTNFVLPSASAVLGVSTHNAETFNVVAHGGDLD
jgi:hypothetical protein